VLALGIRIRDDAAPACTYTVPSLISMVRMAMHVSIVPPNPKYPTAPRRRPRRTGSSSSMISIARIFGAPRGVAGGERRAEGVECSRGFASLPRTFETMCIHVRIALDHEPLGHLDAPTFATAADVVAGRGRGA